MKPVTTQRAYFFPLIIQRLYNEPHRLLFLCCNCLNLMRWVLTLLSKGLAFLESKIWNCGHGNWKHLLLADRPNIMVFSGWKKPHPDGNGVHWSQPCGIFQSGSPRITLSGCSIVKISSHTNTSIDLELWVLQSVNKGFFQWKQVDILQSSL